MRRLATSLLIVFLSLNCLSVSASEYTYNSLFQALSNPERPKPDVDLDPLRKPKEVIEFFGIEPNMQVLDVLAGGGYYTEIISYMVGQQGGVTMHNHAPWYSYFKQEGDARLANQRLKNVVQLNQDINQGTFRENYYDVALIILGLHDLFNQELSAENGDKLDAQRLLISIFNALKPNGVVGVVEHNSAPGSAPQQSATLHRLDSTYIKQLMQNVGFEFIAESNMLANPNDDYQLSVFNSRVRRKTDRAVLKFKKPGR